MYPAIAKIAGRLLVISVDYEAPDDPQALGRCIASQADATRVSFDAGGRVFVSIVVRDHGLGVEKNIVASIEWHATAWLCALDGTDPMQYGCAPQVQLG
jgi:hypothetical protein